MIMDSNKSLAFQFDSINQIKQLEDAWEILLYIEADFSVLVDSNVLYSEPCLCVVEFAFALFKWLAEVEKTGKDFIYESMDFEEVGLVWIKQNESGWRIGSVHQNYKETHNFNLNEIKNAYEKFLSELINKLSANFKIDLQAFLFRELDACQ